MPIAEERPSWPCSISLKYALDADRREGGPADRRSVQVFDVLAFLIANRGRLVSKDEIIEAV
jgi:DNA-binding response OmpR family regulator